MKPTHLFQLPTVRIQVRKHNPIRVSAGSETVAIIIHLPLSSTSHLSPLAVTPYSALHKHKVNPRLCRGTHKV